MRWLSVIFSLLVMSMTTPARAQAFFGGGALAFDPEISTVQSGVLADVRAHVSYDRKYVTLTMGAQQSDLLALTPFVVQPNSGGGAGAGAAMGFVGGANPAQERSATISNSPEEIDRRAVAARSILARRGMFLLRVN